MSIQNLVQIIGAMPGIRVTGFTEKNDILFQSDDAKSLNLLTTKAKLAHWNIILFPSHDTVIYHLFGQDIDKLLDVLTTKKTDGLGIPDLSLVTVKQMAEELKNRPNLSFAIVWIEENNHDNITLEGCGHPDKIIGMLARAMNLAIRHADKGLTQEPPEEDLI